MKIASLLSAIVALGTFAALPTSATAQVYYNFDDPSQLDDFISNGVGSTGWTWKENIGRDGSGGFQANTSPGATPAVYTLKSPFSSIDGFSMSMDFQWSQPTYGVGHGFFMGFGPSPTYTPSTSNASTTGYNQVYFGVGRASATPSDNKARLISNSTNGEDYQTTQKDPAITLTPGAWYQIKGDISYSSSTHKYTLALALYEIDASGSLTLIQSNTVSTLALQQLAEGDIYFFFGSANDPKARGSNAIDNLSISITPIPEASSLALASVGGLALLSAWRMRGSKASIR